MLDLDVELNDSGHEAIARRVCVPFGGEDRYYLTTLPRAIFTPQDVAELYRVRWEVERGRNIPAEMPAIRAFWCSCHSMPVEMPVIRLPSASSMALCRIFVR